MEQNNNMCGSCGGKMGMCGYCGGGHRGFHILRWVLGIVIIMMIFSLGMKIGEFKGEFEGGNMMYGRQMMHYEYQPMMYGGTPQVQGMMGVPATTQVAPVR